MKKILLRTLISAAFLALLFYIMRDDIPLILNTLRNINRPLLAASIVIFLGTILVMAKRLELIFNVKNIPIRFTQSLNLTFVGYFFNNFLPTSVGGDIVKALCAARLTKSGVKSVTAVLMDRIFGLFTFILIPSISLLFSMHHMGNPLVPIMVYSLLIISLLCFFVIFSRGLARRFRFIESFLNRFGAGAKVREIYEGLHDFRNHKSIVWWAMALSVVGQSISIIVLYMLALAIGADAKIAYFFLLVPVVHLVSMLPSLNGLGIREGAYIYFLKPYIGREYAAAIGILWLGLLLLLSVIGGIIYLVRQDYHVQLKRSPRELGVGDSGA